MASCQDRQTLCFLHSHIRTNVPQKRDPFQSTVLHPDKDPEIKIGLGQKCASDLKGAVDKTQQQFHPRTNLMLLPSLFYQTLWEQLQHLDELQWPSPTFVWFVLKVLNMDILHETWEFKAKPSRLNMSLSLLLLLLLVSSRSTLYSNIRHIPRVVAQAWIHHLTLCYLLPFLFYMRCVLV